MTGLLFRKENRELPVDTNKTIYLDCRGETQHDMADGRRRFDLTCHRHSRIALSHVNSVN